MISMSLRHFLKEWTTLANMQVTYDTIRDNLSLDHGINFSYNNQVFLLVAKVIPQVAMEGCAELEEKAQQIANKHGSEISLSPLCQAK